MSIPLFRSNTNFTSCLELRVRTVAAEINLWIAPGWKGIKSSLGRFPMTGVSKIPLVCIQEIQETGIRGPEDSRPPRLVSCPVFTWGRQLLSGGTCASETWQLLIFALTNEGIRFFVFFDCRKQDCRKEWQNFVILICRNPFMNPDDFRLDARVQSGFG